MSAEPDNTNAPIQREQLPYVGLRPYEREERNIFFGRDRDARFLVDKVFSARLTLLYSQSGMGKSSLLRTLVVPKFEEESAHVLYFDDWTSEDPLASLKEALIQVAAHIGVPDADMGAPSLTELIRLITSFERRTLVLVLDQFEEFLISHGQALEALRKEMSELMHADDLDVNVLISLRQEFLAALEPFRSHILNLFDSTYHLESLDDKGIRSAIEGPVKELYGETYKYDADLVDQLIKDLRKLDRTLTQTFYTSQSRRQVHQAEEQIDLPMLQLVCGELWKHRAKETTFSVEFYENLGKAAQILKQYVHSVMPRGKRDQWFTARLMRYLAPPSGLKMSYSLDDMVVAAQLDKGIRKKQRRMRTLVELQRLAGARILRTRQFRGRERFELQHDAFIKIIAPWRDRILTNARRWRYALWTVGILCMLAITPTALVVRAYIDDKQELYAKTEGSLQELEAMDEITRSKLVESRFDSATGHLLLERRGPERLNLLKNLLERYSHLIPGWYGVETSSIQVSPPAGNWPVALHYSSLRNLDEWYFHNIWHTYAKTITEKWSIPVPRRLLLNSDNSLPKRVLLLKVDEDSRELDTLERSANKDSNEEAQAVSYSADLEIEVSTHEDKVFINSHDLPEKAGEFFDRFKDHWIRIEEAKQGGPFWVVPRWSLPVWKISGHVATEGSGYSAFILALTLLDNPEVLLTDEATELLLRRAEDRYPSAVAEARAARGVRLRGDLASIVQQGRSLVHLPLFLDALARYPEQPSKQAADWVSLDVQATSASLPLKLKGPWREKAQLQALGKKQVLAKGKSNITPETQQGSVNLRDVYKEVEGWLPELQAPIRVYIGRNLEQKWVVNEKLAPILNERLEGLREEFLRRLGLELPHVLFRHHTSDTSGALGDNDFRIELLNQTGVEPDAAPIRTTVDESIDRLIDELRIRGKNYRVYWISPDQTRVLLDSVDPKLQLWLEQRYSLTDIKLILRAIVDPTLEELEQWEQDKSEPEEHVGGYQIPAHHTLRYLDWLLRALVFYELEHDHLDIEAVTQSLRDLQKVRLQGLTAVTEQDAKTRVIVNQAISELQKGNFDKAQAAYSSVLEKNRLFAQQLFPSIYAGRHSLAVRLSYAEKCQSPTAAWLDRAERADLKELLETSSNLDKGTRRIFDVCLLASQPYVLGNIRKIEAQRLLREYDDTSLWPPEEALWIAKEMMKRFDPTSDDPQLAEQVEVFLLNALARLDDRQAYNAFRDVVTKCETPGPHNWCFKILDRLTEDSSVIYTKIDAALVFSNIEKHEYLEIGMERAAQAELILQAASNIDEKEKARLYEWINVARAQGFAGKAVLGDPKAASAAEEIYRRLLGSKSVGQQAYISLVDLLISRGAAAEASKILEKALDTWPGVAQFHIENFILQLMNKDEQGARATAENILNQTDETSGTLFIASLGQILMAAGKWEHTGRKFLATDHEYVPYILMMLYALMVDDAKQDAEALLQLRWQTIKKGRAQWPARIRAGDVTAWREMLIGHYEDEVPYSEILPHLESPANYEQSDFRFLPFSRRALLTDAYFYDAILAKAQGDIPRMRRRLDQVVKTNYRGYLEYSMAKYLLWQHFGEWEPLANPQ